MHPVDFANKWSGVTLTERSAAQQHVLDLCAVLDRRIREMQTASP